MNSVWPEALLEDLTEPDSAITYGVIKPGGEGSVRFVRGGDIADGVVLESALRTITEEVSDQYKRTLLRGGELLMSLVGQPGQVAVAGPNLVGANIARQVGLIRLRREVDPYFISYFLRSPDGVDGLRRFTGGSVQQVINLGDLRQVSVPVPSLAEQHRIVAILDEAFEAIATAKANAEKNLRSVASLLAQSIDEQFQRPILQKAPTFLLGELASFRNGINFDRHSNGASVRIVGVKDFQQNFDAPMDDLDWVVLDGQLSAADSVEPGDIVFVRSNGNPELIGRCLLIGQLSEPTTHSGFTIKMRLKGTSVEPRFACHFLKSTSVRRQLIDGGNGASIKSLNQGTLSAVRLPVPTLKEQSEVVEQVEGLKQEAVRLVSVYERKLTALDELKKSLLHQAFTGQL